MKNSKILRLFAVACFPMIAIATLGAEAHKPSITQAVDNTALVSLHGNISSYAVSQNDLGAVGDSVPTGTMYLLLGRSPSQQRQLDQYVLGLSTPGSATFRKWMTPAAFGTSFGANGDDVTTVGSWLESQGFKVEKVSQAKNAIAFSGTFGTVRSAFRTEVHRFKVAGSIRVANISDPQIPAALAPVVRGIVGLARIDASSQPAFSSNQTAGPAMKPKPALTIGTGLADTPYAFAVVAGDAAVIYDTPNAALNPAYSGSTLDGSGVTIGAIEVSNLPAASLQDFANYRVAFLGDTAAQAAAHIPTVVVEGTDPGLVTASGVNDFNGDLFEEPQVAVGDGEISQALAPGSKTILYVAQTVDQALQRAVEDNTVSILINNMDECESWIGAAGNAFLKEEYEQGAAQGITIVANTGNWGSGGCGVIGGTTGGSFNVTGNASTPWNTAVGGTDFQVLYDSASIPTYVNTATAGATGIAGTAPYYTTALSYIPEGAWNNASTVFTTYSDDQNPLDYAGPASGGGLSSEAVCSGSISPIDGTCSGTLSGYPKPAYQISLTPNDGVRDVPDIALFSSKAYQLGFALPVWATCQDGVVNRVELDCADGANQNVVTPYGGTSAATAAAAGIFALVEQSNGARLGLVNPTLYRLSTIAPNAFHDITTGNNSVPCTSGSPNCGSNGYMEGYNAGTGYDYATGLGSLDVAKLVANWGHAGLATSTTALTAGESASSLGSSALTVPHGSSVYFQATVSPSTATGNVAIINNSGAQNGGSLSAVALSGGSASFSSQSLPGGAYSVIANYSGDANDQPSESNSIALTVNPESTKLGLILQSTEPSTGAVTTNPVSIAYGMELGLAVTPYGAAGEGKGTVPTGSVSLSIGSTSAGSQTLGATGVADLSVANTGSLTPGSDSLNVHYSGDQSYEAVTSPIGVTVSKGAVTISSGGVPVCTSLTNSWSVEPTCEVGAEVLTDSVGAAPTGNILITFNGNSQTLPLAATQYGSSTGVSLAGALATTTAIDVSNYVGTYLPAWSATYGGDSNYQGASGTNPAGNKQVVQEPTGATFALTNSGAITVNSGAQGTATITITPASGFMGQVALSCTVSGGTGSSIPTCTIPSTSTTFTSNSAKTVTLTIGTTATGGAVKKSSQIFIAGGNGMFAIGVFLLCGRFLRSRSLAAGLFIVLISIPVLFALSGCGGSRSTGTAGGGGTTGTPTGTYSVTVTATNPNVTYNQGWVSNPITASTTAGVTVN